MGCLLWDKLEQIAVAFGRQKHGHWKLINDQKWEEMMSMYDIIKRIALSIFCLA